jgi:two-component sensor histidine kinase
MEDIMTIEMFRESVRAPSVLPALALETCNEVDHRVANSLQMLSALLSLQCREVADPAARAALDEAVGRIAAVAAVHRRLYQSKARNFVDIAGYIIDLAESLEEGCGRGPRHRPIHVEIEERMVRGEFACLIGILVAELVMNACKHAYAVDEPGGIDVRLFFRNGSDFSLEVRDYGRGADPRAYRRAEGFGSRIIDSLTARLHALYTYVPSPEGTRFILSGRMPGERN